MSLAKDGFAGGVAQDDRDVALGGPLGARLFAFDEDERQAPSENFAGDATADAAGAADDDVVAEMSDFAVHATAAEKHAEFGLYHSVSEGPDGHADNTEPQKNQNDVENLAGMRELIFRFGADGGNRHQRGVEAVGPGPVLGETESQRADAEQRGHRPDRNGYMAEQAHARIIRGLAAETRGFGKAGPHAQPGGKPGNGYAIRNRAAGLC